jgi:hypothetical protein
MQKDKIRDMLRSILPSKGERSARFEKAHANKQNRVRIRQTLRQYNNEEWGEDSEEKMEARIHNSDRRRHYNIRMMKSERRAADKINHFVHWCKKRTAHIEDDQPQEKYFYISSLIGGPSDMIREHALGHFMSPDYDFNVVARESWRYSWRHRVKEVNGAGHGLFDRAAFTKALRWAYEHCPGQLNRALKGNQRCGFSSRMGFEACLLWQGCKPEDACTETYYRQERQYTYQTSGSYGLLRTSWNKPLRYREGTLVSQMVEREHVAHDSGICRNKILVTCEDDIERITNKFFGNKDVYHKPYYAEGTLADRLIPFLVAKGLLEEKGE